MGTFPLSAEGDADLSSLVAEFNAAGLALSAFKATALLATGAITTLGGGLAISVVKAADFQKEMVRLNTLVGISEEQMADFEESILRLAPALGTAPEEMAKALFAITSGGERSAEAIDLLEQSAKASRIGLGDMAAIGRVATAALQAFGKENITAEEAIDVMVATVREGNLVAEELSTAFGRVIGIASTMGASFQDVGAFIATFTRLGVNAEIAATSLRAALTAILNPGKEARDTFDAIGLSIDEMRRKIAEDGITSAFIDLLAAAEGNQDVIGALIPNIRALSGVLGTAGVQSKQFIQINKEIQNSLGLTNQGFARVQETAEDAWVDFKIQVESAAVTLGRFFLPPLTELLRSMQLLTDFLGEAAVKFGTLIQAMTSRDTFIAFDAMEGFVIKNRKAIDDYSEDLDRLRQLDRAGLEEMKRQLDERSRILGQLQIENTGDDPDRTAELLHRFNRVAALRRETERLLQEIPTEPLRLDDEIRALVGPTEKQKEAVARLIEKLEEQKLTLEDNKWAIIERTLAQNNATNSDIARVKTLFNEIQAIEASTEARKEAQAEAERLERRLQTIREARERDFQRGRAQAEQDRQREKDREAALMVELQVRAIERDIDRMVDLAKAMSREFTNGMLKMAQSTEDFGDAFRDMVTRILLEVARLKIEEAIIGPLLRALIQIPAEPAPVPIPTIDPTEGIPADLLGRSPARAAFGSITAGGAFTGGSQTVVVQQVINHDISMVDSSSGRDFLRRHAGDLAEIQAKAARSSVYVASKLRGR